RFGFARFHGRFFGSPWPWWWGGLTIGWIGPVFWPYVYYDFFDYVFWPYAYDDFWPYAYDDVYYGIYGPYAYGGPRPALAARPGHCCWSGRGRSRSGRQHDRGARGDCRQFGATRSRSLQQWRLGPDGLAHCAHL